MVKEKVHAIINIGTLKVKSLLAYFDGNGQIVSLHRSNNLTCFGCGMFESGNHVLSENLQATIRELLSLKEIMARFQCSGASVFATHALRDAVNRDFVIQKIKQETGFDVEIIGPEEEGQLYFQAVLADLPKSQDFIVVDMGGGSCQILISNQGELEQNYSFKTGGQFLHERFTTDPHNPNSRNTLGDVEKIKAHLENEYAALPENLGLPLVYGSSNIIDLLRVLKIPLEEYHGFFAHPYKTTNQHLENFVSHIINFPFNERERMYSFQEGYMWGVDKAFLNIIVLSKKFNAPFILPTNASIIEGFLRKVQGGS